MDLVHESLFVCTIVDWIGCFHVYIVVLSSVLVELIYSECS